MVLHFFFFWFSRTLNPLHDKLLRDALHVVEPLTAEVRTLRIENRILRARVEELEAGVSPRRTIHHSGSVSLQSDNQMPFTPSPDQTPDRVQEMEDTITKLRDHIDSSANGHDARDRDFVALLQTRKKDVEMIQHLTAVTDEQRQRLQRNRVVAGDAVNVLAASLLSQLRMAHGSGSPETFLRQWVAADDGWRRYRTMLQGTVVEWANCDVVPTGPLTVQTHAGSNLVTVCGTFGKLFLHAILIRHGESWSVVTLSSYL